MQLDLVDAAFGVTTTVDLDLPGPCDRCDGTGGEPGTHAERCPECGTPYARDPLGFAHSPEMHFQNAYVWIIFISSLDPRVTLALNADVHEVFNACRVKYTNRNGRPREVILHADGSDIASPVKAQTVEAPESVKTKHGAIRCGQRFLRNHKRATVTGTATLYGMSDVWGDAMLIRPQGKLRIKGVPKPFSGPHKITRVQLDPTQWAATLDFGVESRRFDVWLKRVAAGAHVRQR